MPAGVTKPGTTPAPNTEVTAPATSTASSKEWRRWLSRARTRETPASFPASAAPPQAPRQHRRKTSSRAIHPYARTLRKHPLYPESCPVSATSKEQHPSPDDDEQGARHQHNE
jgi:hypothetical protein